MPFIEQVTRLDGVRYRVRARDEHGKKLSFGVFADRQDAAERLREIKSVYPDRRSGNSRSSKQHRLTVQERLEAKSSRALNGCLLWNGRTDKEGYGRINYGRTSGGFARPVLVHRLSYELNVGPLVPGLTIDHLCHNDDPSCDLGPDCLHRRCFEPSHLDQVTAVENKRRSMNRGAADV